MNECGAFFSVYRAIFNVLLLVFGVSFILTGIMIGVLEAIEPSVEVTGTVVEVDDSMIKDGKKKVVIYYTHEDEGYLIKTTDNKKKRYLSLSGKEFIPITGNMADVDKKIAKQGQENAQRWADYYEMENKGLKKENEQLTAENLNLSKVLRGLRKETYGKVIPLLIQSEIRIACLEQLFLNNGCSKEKLEQLIRENNYYDFSIVDFLKSDLQEHLTQEELEDLVKPTSYAYKIQTIIKSPKSSGVV